MDREGHFCRDCPNSARRYCPQELEYQEKTYAAWRKILYGRRNQMAVFLTQDLFGKKVSPEGCEKCMKKTDADFETQGLEGY